MKKLYVGCRVRVLWKRSGTTPPGSEGRIVSAGYWPAGTETKSGDIYLFDGEFLVDLGMRDPGLFLGEQLEPIQDPGHQLVSWSECLWQPQGEVA